jgi:hypothetical protein
MIRCFNIKNFTLPVSDGTTGQFLKTDGSGNLAFATVNQFITLSDGSDTDQYNTSETLLFTRRYSQVVTAVTDNQVIIFNWCWYQLVQLN